MSVINRITKLEPYTPSSRGVNSSSNWQYSDWNESHFGPSPTVLRRIQESILDKDFFQKYPNTDSTELVSLLSDYTGLKSENISIYNGSDDALKEIFISFLDETSKVITYSPSYTQVDTFISLSTDKHHKEKIIDPIGKHYYNFENIKNYDLVYLANPNNPTGYLIDKTEIELLVSKNLDTLFIIDEAYYEFSKQTCSDLVTKYNNIIITRTFSKAFGLASLRIGYILASKQKIEFLDKIRNVKSVNQIAQIAASTSLEDLSYLSYCVKETKKSKEFLENFIKNSLTFECFENSHANFVLIKTKDSKSLVNLMLKNKVLIRDRSNMPGLKNCVRITVGSIENVKKIINILKQFESKQ